MKKSVREPIPELFLAAELLNRAVSAHLAGDFETASKLFEEADMPVLREWTESHWGKDTPYKKVLFPDESKPLLSKQDRIPVRMPNREEKEALHRRDGFHCRFCGVPVIRKEVRVKLRNFYPNVIKWGRTNGDQHAAFQALWLQYDHILPHSRGGDNSIDNIVITCAPCNYVRMDNLVHEMGLSHPLERSPIKSDWDGLERILKN